MAYQRAANRQEVLAALSDHEVTTAPKLAARLNVCERTIHRYIKELRAAGAPIRGEAGMGFQLRRKPEGVANG
ncbi:HTH domain-containing protein [Mesorhizobium neociceri]|uniref:Helix-turn-helix domain-containing protein n=1 Tax=Mesorhizobium neociceri TaxID=1307853 RepID=A0A838B517_9HYPH|nr:helix-turn-helix domain-containing protein [Mesorhizobium neociceri]MBA1141716.1 helix-turn-helix domain-containing protein [Mesorhizobium neociceri]